MKSIELYFQCHSLCLPPGWQGHDCVIVCVWDWSSRVIGHCLETNRYFKTILTPLSIVSQVLIWIDWGSTLCSIFIFLAFNVTAFFCPYATNLRCQFCWYCLSKNQRGGGFFVGLYFVGLCQIKCTICGFKYHCLAILWYYPIRSAALPACLTPSDTKY